MLFATKPPKITQVLEVKLCKASLISEALGQVWRGDATDWPDVLKEVERERDGGRTTLMHWRNS